MISKSKLSKIALTLDVLLIITHSTVTTSHNKETIQICSTSQIINIPTNTITFQGKVILKYKNIHIYADKIFINHTNNKQDLSTIKACGNPVILYQTQKLNDKISAQSLIINYNTNENTITLIGNACIKKSGNSIHGDNIIYTINNQQIQAIANQGNQITAILTIPPTNKK